MRNTLVLLFLVIYGLCQCHNDEKLAITLNLASVDRSRVDVSLKVQEGIEYIYYTPHTNVEIKLIVHNGKLLWIPSGEDKCILLTTYYRQGFSVLVSLYAQGTDGVKPLYFIVKTNGDWVGIEEGDFTNRFDNMKPDNGKNWQVHRQDNAPRRNSEPINIGAINVPRMNADDQRRTSEGDTNSVVAEKNAVQKATESFGNMLLAKFNNVTKIMTEHTRAGHSRRPSEPEESSQEKPNKPIATPKRQAPKPPSEPKGRTQEKPNKPIATPKRQAPKPPSEPKGRTQEKPNKPVASPKRQAPKPPVAKVPVHPQRQAHLKRRASAPPSILNVTSVDPIKVQFTSVEQDGIRQETYLPSEEPFVEVKEGSASIWKASGAERCTGLYTHSKEGRPELLTIYVKTGTDLDCKYFEEADVNTSTPKQWKEIDRGTFDLKHLLMKGIAPKDPLGLVLDLSNPDTTKIRVNEAIDNGITHKSFFSSGDEFFTEVVDNGKSLWNAAENERCSIVYTSTDGAVERLTLYTKKDEEYILKYYCKNTSGHWKSVTKQEYDTYVAKDVILGLTLDLGDVDSNLINTTTNSSNGLKYFSYLPKDDVFFGRVVENGNEVWMAKPDQKCNTVLAYFSNDAPYLLAIFSKQESGHTFEYFENVYHNWYAVDEEVFNKRVESLRVPLYESYKLDLSKVDNDKIFTSTGTYSGISYLAHFPKGVQIVSVVDKTQNLWEGDINRSCTYLSSYSKKDHPTLLYLRITSYNNIYYIYFKNKGGLWTEIGENEFLKEDWSMKKELTPEEIYAKYGMHLNLSVYDPAKVKASALFYNGTKFRTYHPKGEHFFTQISMAGKVIWTGEFGKECYDVQLYLDGISPYLISLNIKHGITFNMSYFVRLDGEWNEIDEDEFYRKLKELRKAEPIKPADLVNATPSPTVTVDDAKVETLDTSKVETTDAPKTDETLDTPQYNHSVILDTTKAPGVEQIYIDEPLTFEAEADEGSETPSGDAEEPTDKTDDSLDTEDAETEEPYVYGPINYVKNALTSDVDDNELLDVSKLDRDVDIFRPFTNSQYVIVTYHPDHLITKVIDGKYDMWEGTYEEACISTSFYVRNRKAVLAYFVIEGGVINLRPLFFERRIFGWYQVTEELFNFRIKQLNSVSDGFLTNSLYAIPLLFTVVSLFIL